MELIFDSEMKVFPPRLAEQPIFYPVLNRNYAVRIARDWNTREASAAGYVTRFEVPDNLSDRYESRIVGDSECEEWWVPANELSDFNSVVTSLRVECGFFGPAYTGPACTVAGLKGKTAREQLKALVNNLAYSSFDVWCETYVNRKTIFMNFLFWSSIDLSELQISEEQRQQLLDFIENRWSQSDIPFPLPGDRG